MPETLLVVVLVVLLVAGGLLAPLLAWTTVLKLGVLARVLAARGELPPRWWLSPTRLHVRLRGAERRSVLRWFFAGGAGFVITLAGCLAAFVGALLAD